MANIHTGKLPLIGDVVESIMIDGCGFSVKFKSGASVYSHAYTDTRQYESFREDGLPNCDGNVHPEQISENNNQVSKET